MSAWLVARGNKSSYLYPVCDFLSDCQSLIPGTDDHAVLVILDHLNLAALLDLVTLHKFQHLRYSEHPFNSVAFATLCLGQCLHKNTSLRCQGCYLSYILKCQV